MSSQGLSAALDKRAQAGDRSAFDRLASKFRGRLSALAHLRLGTRLREKVETDDVIQDVLLKAFRSVKKVAFDDERSFFKWLARITEHVVVDTARKHGSRPISPLLEEVPGRSVSPSKGLRRGERFLRLQNALDSLSPDDREIVILARLEGLSLKEVAERMGRSYAASAQLLSRALQKLRVSFGDTESLHLPDLVLANKRDKDG